MDLAAIFERAEEIVSAREDDGAGREALESALRAGAQLRAWLAASEVELMRRLSAQVSFPEHAVAECTRTSLNDALRVA
jgi:hypothetical protein